MSRDQRKTEVLRRELGVRVFRRRQQCDMSIPALAARCDLHENTITNVENGKGCSLVTLVLIAQALGVKVDDLILLPQ